VAGDVNIWDQASGKLKKSYKVILFWNAAHKTEFAFLTQMYQPVYSDTKLQQVLKRPEIGRNR